MTGKLNMVVSDGMYLQGSGFGADVNVSVGNGAYLELGLVGPPSVSTVLSGNLSVATGGLVGLAQDATCNTLTLGAATQPAGSHGSTSSPATYQNNTYFSGTSVLNVAAAIMAPVTEYRSAVNTAADAKLAIFPNPSSDRSILSFNSEFGGDYTISVLDLSGRVMIQETRGGVAGLNNAEIDISGLSKGVYMVNLLNEGKSISKKLVVQ